MRRRNFIVVASGVLAFPVGALAQQPMPVVGFLNAFEELATRGPLETFTRGLREMGYVEGRNVAIESRTGSADYDQLRIFAEEFVRIKVALIASLGLPAALAAKAATSTIPIVFWNAGDPVADGLVTNLSRPGGNLTGVAVFNNTLAAKRLEMLRQLIPDATAFALLVNPAHPSAEQQSKDTETAANSLGVKLRIWRARTEDEIEAAFAGLASRRVDGLAVASDPYLFGQRERVIALAARHAIPTIYTVRAYCQAGGLISYSGAGGEVLEVEYGRYVGRVLKGERPADMPVHRSTNFNLAINLKTAKSLGLTVPPALVAQATEVIE